MNTYVAQNQIETQDHINDDEQYSLAKIMGIWAIVSLPMPLMAFVIAPAVAARISMNHVLVVWLFMIVGMIWQFIVSLWIIYQELGTLRWSILRERTWLNTPRDPHTDEANAKLWWWLVPAFAFVLAGEFLIGGLLDAGWLRLLPFLSRTPNMDLNQIMTPEFIGAWCLVSIALVSNLFNYVLGEELLFRGVLLPKMRGVFRKWDWLTNAVLFALYHLHRPTTIPSILFTGLALSWTSRHFRSNWFALILHGYEGLFVIIGVLGVVTGAAF